MPDAYNVTQRIMGGLRRESHLHVAFPPHPEPEHPRHNAFVVKDEDGKQWWVSVRAEQ